MRSTFVSRDLDGNDGLALYEAQPCAECHIPRILISSHRKIQIAARPNVVRIRWAYTLNMPANAVLYSGCRAASLSGWLDAIIRRAQSLARRKIFHATGSASFPLSTTERRSQGVVDEVCVLRQRYPGPPSQLSEFSPKSLAQKSPPNKPGFRMTCGTASFVA
jgi:hypothetical protein